jgi:hypothetical protein
MAGANRTPLVFPEARYAELFSAEHGLTPPIDIEEVLSPYADIELDDLPGTADAVLLRRESRKSLIVVSRKLTASRFRFTLTHELGHLVLPWQVGSAFCHPNATYVTSRNLHQEVEAQANRFATELLIPRDWALAELGKRGDDLAERIVNIAQKAGVSPITASLTLGSCFPFPAATCIVDSAGNAQYSTATSDLPIKKDVRWWSELSTQRIGAVVTSKKFGRYLLFAITFDDASPKLLRRPAHQAREILGEILDTVPVADRASLMHTVAGIVGASNSMAPAGASPSELLTRLQRRFFGRTELTAVTEHRRFREYLRARAFELRDKKIQR